MHSKKIRVCLYGVRSFKIKHRAEIASHCYQRAPDLRWVLLINSPAAARLPCGFLNQLIGCIWCVSLKRFLSSTVWQCSMSQTRYVVFPETPTCVYCFVEVKDFLKWRGASHLNLMWVEWFGKAQLAWLVAYVEYNSLIMCEGNRGLWRINSFEI